SVLSQERCGLPQQPLSITSPSAASRALHQAPAESAVLARRAQVARAIPQALADVGRGRVRRLRQGEGGGGSDEGRREGGAGVVAAAVATTRAPDVNARRGEVDV